MLPEKVQFHFIGFRHIRCEVLTKQTEDTSYTVVFMLRFLFSVTGMTSCPDRAAAPRLPPADSLIPLSLLTPKHLLKY